MSRTVGLILPVEPEKRGKKPDKTLDAAKDHGKKGSSEESGEPEAPSRKGGKNDD